MQLYPGYRHQDVLSMPARLFHHLLLTRGRGVTRTDAPVAQGAAGGYSAADIAAITEKHAARLRQS